MDDLFFDEQLLYDDIKSNLEATFNTPEWKKQFGGRKVEFYNSLKIDKPKFPAVYIQITNSYPVDEMRTSAQVEPYTRFEIEIQTFTQEVQIDNMRVSKERIGILLNAEIKRVIARIYRLNCTRNGSIPNIDSNIHRRILNYTGIVDNKTKMIYNI